MSSEISMRRIIIKSVIWFGIMFALLFSGAGTLAWPEGWLYIVIQVGSSVIMLRWLEKHNPELLRVRMEFRKRITKSWDKAIMISFLAGTMPVFFLPGLDAVRYRWSHVPIPVEILGFLGMAASSALIFSVMKTNPYSSAVVEIQKDRGHEVIKTGPYQFVRHSMYVGAVLWFVFTPLALGSYVTFVPSAILTALIVTRTYLEDKTLHRELEGYAAYAETVKYRLFPGIW